MPFDGTLSGLLHSSFLNILSKNDPSIALRLCVFARKKAFLSKNPYSGNKSEIYHVVFPADERRSELNILVLNTNSKIKSCNFFVTQSRKDFICRKTSLCELLFKPLSSITVKNTYRSNITSPFLSSICPLGCTSFA